MADLVGDAWHNEQRRKSQDLIRVFNPTSEDYVLKWDNERFVVPNKDKDSGWGKGQRVMQRYLAQKFTKEIVDKIIFEMADEKLREIKAALNRQGAVDIAFNANMKLQGVQGMRSDDPTVRQPIEDEVWMGIEEEFGVDREFVPIKEAKPMTFVDPFERLENKKVKKDDLKMPGLIDPTPKKEVK